MSKVKILRGISGSGKSTFATSIPNAAICSADDYFTAGNVYAFDAKKLPEAHAQCLRRFLWLVQNAEIDHTIVVDNTNTTVEEIAPYYALAEAYWRDVEVITIDTPPAFAHPRNVHNVDRDAVVRQHARLWKTELPKRWKHRIVQGEGF